MSTYRRPLDDLRPARELSVRGRRSHRLWLWLWCLVAAALLLTALALARDGAQVLVSGLLAHPHA